MPADHQALRAGHLLSELRQHPPRRKLSRRTQVVGTLAAATIVTGTGLGAAAAGVLTVGGAGDTTTVQCNDRATRDAHATIAKRTAEDPVNICRDLWSTGEVGSTRVPPPLVGCVTARDELPGQVSVYPGLPGTCEQLDLEPARNPTNEERAYAARIRTLDRDLTRAIDRCPTRDELVAVARSALRRHHLTGWKVQLTTNEDVCPVHTIDQPHTTVRIVGR